MDQARNNWAAGKPECAVSVRGWGQLPKCCDRGVWGQVGWTRRATKVDGLKRGVRCVCQGVGSAARVLRLWRLGPGGLAFKNFD